MKARETAQKLLWDQDTDSDDDADEESKLRAVKTRANNMIAAAKQRADLWHRQQTCLEESRAQTHVCG